MTRFFECYLVSFIGAIKRREKYKIMSLKKLLETKKQICVAVCTGMTNVYIDVSRDDLRRIARDLDAQSLPLYYGELGGMLFFNARKNNALDNPVTIDI